MSPRPRPAGRSLALALVGVLAGAVLSTAWPRAPAGAVPATAQAQNSQDRSRSRVAVAAVAKLARHGQAKPPRSFTLAVTGDLLPHRPVVRRAAEYGGATGTPFDFLPMLAPLTPLLSGADLALCHLEVPLAPAGQPLSGFPVFSVPQELGTAIAAAGFDGCSTASNHALDRGAAGVADTRTALEAAGVAVSGTARSAQEDAATPLRQVRGVTVAHLSYTYGLNGFTLPAEAPWLVDVIAVPAILADAAAARQAGAEVTVVSLHWGVEYVGRPTNEQRAVAEALAASPDVDLLVGHHAHVVQPIERLGDVVVVYGLGNLLSNQGGWCCGAASQDGLLVQVTFAEDPTPHAARRFRATDVRATPTFVEHPSFRVLPVPDLLADPTVEPALRAQLEASYARTTATVGVPDP